jgi:hypothetical protein
MEDLLAKGGGLQKAMPVLSAFGTNPLKAQASALPQETAPL